MADDLPEFLDPVEDCPWRSPREILASHGYLPLAPEELDDRQLPGRLWELIYAAAARRFFFWYTDHLDDRNLYRLLWQEWLDEPTADIPPEAETNTHVMMSEFDAAGLTREEIEIRYYASESDRDLWLTDDPDFIFPPHESPPHDRDRFLPTPPVPLEAHAGWLPGDDDLPEDAEPDPLGLAEVDREIAAAQAEARPDEAPPDELPKAALEAQLSATEPQNWTPPAGQLAGQNIPLLPPAEITGETLTPILWELLHNLALRGFYVLHTDHLSDREVYAELWERGLRDPACLPGRNPRGGWYHDFLGSWGDEENQLWLRYYASDEQRAKHIAEWPKATLPPRDKPANNRDWRLPKGPF